MRSHFRHKMGDLGEGAQNLRRSQVLNDLPLGPPPCNFNENFTFAMIFFTVYKFQSLVTLAFFKLFPKIVKQALEKSQNSS